jgi:hypothetical protein
LELHHKWSKPEEDFYTPKFSWQLGSKLVNILLVKQHTHRPTELDQNNNNKQLRNLIWRIDLQ